MKVTLDTNVLVRLATQDDAAQAAKALQVLQNATLIAVPTPALCELVWVLLRGYRYTPAQVAQAVRTLIQVRNVVCHTPTVLGATLPTAPSPTRANCSVGPSSSPSTSRRPGS